MNNYSTYRNQFFLFHKDIVECLIGYLHQILSRCIMLTVVKTSVLVINLINLNHNGSSLSFDRKKKNYAGVLLE